MMPSDMSGCCDPRGCDAFFGERFAGRVAKRYRKRGLDRTSQRIVDFLAERGIVGATVLEIGGGVGEIQIELLKRGARRTVNLELSGAYEREARALLAEAGLAGRAERRLHDIAVAPDLVEPVDAVVLHRVVCCYPDYERLLGAAAGRAGRLLVFSYPRRNPLTRLFVATQNFVFAVMRREFRTFTHPPTAMVDVLRARGLEPAYARGGAIWRVAGLAR
jgi:cyclopropane fatty-acyl-phospholipid synthase-like methyltransferase